MTVRYYKTQLVKRGPYVPLKVWFAPSRDPETGEELDRSPTWKAMRNGHEVPIEDVIIEFNPAGEPIIGAEEIPESEYHYFDTINALARQTNPDAPEASPRDPIDLHRLPTLF